MFKAVLSTTLALYNGILALLPASHMPWNILPASDGHLPPSESCGPWWQWLHLVTPNCLNPLSPSLLALKSLAHYFGPSQVGCIALAACLAHALEGSANIWCPFPIVCLHPDKTLAGYGFSIRVFRGFLKAWSTMTNSRSRGEVCKEVCALPFRLQFFPKKRLALGFCGARKRKGLSGTQSRPAFLEGKKSF